ncbi:hypothetical protein GTZ99_00530 [Novosphingobium sp. FSY-8]|uniref:Regulatory protein RecX n=1 Tax=Novosphingobium ovatum TaxID=1908523 RepID=A0ABW9X930_9SPHN|nr:RecX family transcriptional regulator [Novosphingobium ovatum]NBC35039.1 hypothetical protein [Novosphingobium ovatum]
MQDVNQSSSGDPHQPPGESDDPRGRTGGRARRGQREKRAPRPLDIATFEALALHHVARFATSAAKLEAYLRRKLRERGWAGEAPHEGEVAAADIVARFIRAGYVDDAGFAQARSASLQRRGFGARRIDQALMQAGIAEPIRTDVRPDEAAARAAALALARRKRFGPWRRDADAGRMEPKEREKQVAAMVRAGHGLGIVRVLLDSPDIATAESWAQAVDGDESSHAEEDWDGPTGDF